MADFKALRTELADKVPSGYNTSLDVDAGVKTPGVMVSMPSFIQWVGDSLPKGQVTVNTRLVVVVGTTKDSEDKLLHIAMDIASQYHGIRGTNFTACHVVSIEPDQTYTNGGKDSFAATINLQLIVKI